MSDSKHTPTPGPWTCVGGTFADCGKDEAAFIVKAKGMVLNMTNARLIAAAPDTAAERDRLKALCGELATILEGGVGLIRSDLIGVEWKRGCASFVRDAAPALARAKEQAK